MLALVDANGTGFPDVVVTRPVSNCIAVVPSLGGGGFGTPTIFAAGVTPAALAVADLDGDGKLDIAVADHGSSQVTVLFGSGSGTFGSNVNNPCGSAPNAVETGDFNNDGRLDLIVIRDNGAYAILLSTGCAPTARRSRRSRARARARSPSATSMPTGSSTRSSFAFRRTTCGRFLGMATGRSRRSPPSPWDCSPSGRASTTSTPTESWISSPPRTSASAARSPMAMAPGVHDSQVRRHGVPAAGFETADLNGDGSLDFAVTDVDTGHAVVIYGVPPASTRRSSPIPRAPSPMRSRWPTSTTTGFPTSSSANPTHPAMGFAWGRGRPLRSGGSHECRA